MRLASLLCAGLFFALTGCAERRDAAVVAAGIAPFNELGGINITTLRAGGLRAFRRGAEAAPWEGLREPIGAFDVLFAVPAFVGSDSSWPPEDALVSEIEATRDWPSDSSAGEAWLASVSEIRAATGATPSCVDLTGPGFSLRVVEFPRGGTWVLAAALAPETTLTNGSQLSARHSLALRRESITVRYPEAGAPNPDERPTWNSADCPAFIG
jgi:hypothetical protein